MRPAVSEVGVADVEEPKHAGWPDIEVGGPGMGPFPSVKGWRALGSLSDSRPFAASGFPLGSALAGTLITRSASATFLLAGLASMLAIAVSKIPSEATISA